MISWHDVEGHRKKDEVTSEILSELVKRAVYRASVFLPTMVVYMHSVEDCISALGYIYIFRDKVES